MAAAGRRLMVAGSSARTTPARITDFRQIRAIADPLRIRMLQLFAEEPLTTKQVADRLGEKPTRLYNHTRALEQAGLIRLVRTRQNRGTTERYLEAVGSLFEVDERLFAPGPRGSGGQEGTSSIAAALLRSAAAELANRATESKDPAPVVGQILLRLTPKEYDRLCAKVLRWIKGVKGSHRSGARRSGGDARDAILTLALVPAQRARASGQGSRSRPGSS
jgi:DNA-binding transcriptional ArsR family regulator